MQIQPLMLIVTSLATVLMNPVIRGIWETSSDAPRSSRVDLAQLPAPTGHRQPTLNDLPPWLRDEEKPGAEASPTQTRKLAVQMSSKEIGATNNHERRGYSPMTAFPEFATPANILQRVICR